MDLFSSSELFVGSPSKARLVQFFFARGALDRSLLETREHARVLLAGGFGGQGGLLCQCDVPNTSHHFHWALKRVLLSRTRLKVVLRLHRVTVVLF